MTEDIFDFGFTAVTEEELEVVQKSSTEKDAVESRLDKLYNAIQPLLDNLRKNPEKDYIYWPNRLDKVDQFRDYIDDIYTGK
jgi:hypothetical protein